MISETETKIGNCERVFDRARDRVGQLEIDLASAANALDREGRDFYCNKIRKQKQRIEVDLASARDEMASAREALEGAWAMRNQNGEEQ
jgi:hypothetical protein